MHDDDPPALFFASASRGTEQVLASELGAMGVSRCRIQRGGVAFGSRIEDGYRACLWSRVASRVLMPLTEFEATDASSLYEGVHALCWTDHLGPERTLAVSVAGSGAASGPPHFVALKTKDAIVDRIRETEGARPDVDKRNPDVRVHVHVREARVIVSLDMAGRGLHRRGLGRQGAAAPLRENLAAALLHIAGWPAVCRSVPLYDPMCGAATLLTEAAGIALDVAPGLGRDRSGLEGWRSHDEALWHRLRAEARERRQAGKNHEVRISGSDSSRTAVETARHIVELAGHAKRISVDPRPLVEVTEPPGGPGLLVTNPPYGARLGEAGELGPLYEQIGDLLKRRFPGWTAWLLSGNPALTKRIGLRARSRSIVFNGPIECRFLELPIAASPASRDSRPAWRKPGPHSRGFAKRLRKNADRLGRWARTEDLNCYRLYDSDVPEFNVAVDWYDGAVRVEEYAPPRSVAPEVAEQRLQEAVRVVADTLKVDPARIVVRVRRKLEQREQHMRYGDAGRFFEVRENGLRFHVNLTDYLDTGLFLDDRLLRRWIRDNAAGRDFLNLFAYTCSASVAAAAGKARSTTSVDLSRTYLDWGSRNFELNGLAAPEHRFVRADAIRYLRERRDRRRFGMIFVAPPTRSASKGMRVDFELQRDHAALLTSVGATLEREGAILFSSNLRTFELDEDRLGDLAAEEITADVTPPDFSRRPRLRAWLLRP